MVKLRSELLLIHDRVDRSLGDDSCLGHLLHGVELFLLAEFYLPHFAKTASSDHIVELKRVFVNR